MDMFWVFVWLLMLVAVIAAYVTYMSWNHGLFKKMGVPGPKPLPVIGNLVEMIRRGMHGADLYWCQKYGKVFGIYSATAPMLMVSDEEMLRQIMLKDFNNFPNRQELPSKMVGFPMDQSLVFSKDDHWRFMRNFMTPTFSAGKLKRMTSLINTLSNRLVEILKEKAGDTEDIQIKSFLERYTMDVIAGTAFGMQVDALNNDRDPFVQNSKAILSSSTINSAYIVFITFFPFLIPLMSFLGYHLFPEQNMDFFVQVTNKLLKERKGDASSNRFNDFIQLMVNAEEETRLQQKQNGSNGMKRDGETVGLTNAEINAAALLFFIAGYDTTASTMSFFVYNMALHPEVQERLAEEIDSILGDASSLDYEDIQKFEYLDMCLNETLRVHPPSVRVDRTCVKDTEVKGIKIPRGTVIGIPIYAIHHDADRWENPEHFDPERFSAANRANHSQFAFLPFGTGPRNCIGMRLALMEAKITLIKLFRSFRFSPCSKTEIPLKFANAALLRPAEGLCLKIEKR